MNKFKILVITETHADELLMHVCYQKISADCPSLGNTEKDPVQILSVNVGTLLVNGSLTFFIGSLFRALSHYHQY